MRCLVHGLESVAGEVGVDLGRREIGVTEELLDDSQVGTTFQEVGCVGVAERVRCR